MRSLRLKDLRYLTQCSIAIILLFTSSYCFSQQLTEGLSLRIGPSVGFPYSIELPSGTDIRIIQRRDDWLLVKDQRGETGWALLTNVDLAGGLQGRQAWRLVELKEPIKDQISGQLFSDKSGLGWGLAWAFPFSDYHLSSEYQQSNNYEAQWKSVSAWLTAQEPLTGGAFYRYGFGAGYGLENDSSYVLTDRGESRDSVYWGTELSIGFTPNQKFESGLKLRYISADFQGDYSSYQVSWYWAVGI